MASVGLSVREKLAQTNTAQAHVRLPHSSLIRLNSILAIHLLVQAPYALPRTTTTHFILTEGCSYTIFKVDIDIGYSSYG